jgi:hypothetical protein
MNPKTRNYLIIGIASALIVGVTTFFILKRKKQVGKTIFRRRAVKYANEEYKKFQEGKLKETNQSVYDDLKRYWDSIQWNESRWSPTGTAWSSAFISYIMRKAGAKDDFKYASSHSKYIVEAIKNRKENNNNKFKGYKLNEKKVEIGDLVCYARQDGITYNTTGDYASHCDIVVSIDGDYAEGIGGNVSDSVSQKKIPLADGFVKDGAKRFVLIKTK